MGKKVNETVIKPAAETLADPHLTYNVQEYLSNITEKVTEGSKKSYDYVSTTLTHTWQEGKQLSSQMKSNKREPEIQRNDTGSSYNGNGYDRYESQGSMYNGGASDSYGSQRSGSRSSVNISSQQPQQQQNQGNWDNDWDNGWGSNGSNGSNQNGNNSSRSNEKRQSTASTSNRSSSSTGSLAPTSRSSSQTVSKAKSDDDWTNW